jgi:hypothetical protein
MRRSTMFIVLLLLMGPVGCGKGGNVNGFIPGLPEGVGSDLASMGRNCSSLCGKRDEPVRRDRRRRVPLDR